MFSMSIIAFVLIFTGSIFCYGLDYISISNAEITKRHRETIYPCVRINTPSAGGSGTLIYSKANGSEFSTYILTNFHVVSDAITVKTVWDSTLGKEVKKEFKDIVKVGKFIYKKESYRVGVAQVDAKIITYNEEEDMAILKLENTSEKYFHVACFLPKEKAYTLRLTQPTWAVGCSLGHPPIITPGVITHLYTRIEGYNYGMSTSQIIFGNSGGALYIRGDHKYRLIGIPSRVPVIRLGFGGAPITHMGFFIPIQRILRWIDKENLQFLYDKAYSEKECLKKRKEMGMKKPKIKEEDIKKNLEGKTRH